MTTRPDLDISLRYRPHEGQVRFHETRSHVKVAMCGRRFGKSRMAFGELMYCYREMLTVPRPQSLIPSFLAWVVAPVENQGQQAWEEMLALIPPGFRRKVDQDKRIIYLHGSDKWQLGAVPEDDDLDTDVGYGKIELKSAFNPDSLQTVGLDFLWVTEAQDVSDRAFQKVAPTRISPLRLGRRVYEGIPPTYPEHWFWRNYEMAQRTRGYLAYHATAFENPMLTEGQLEEIERDKETMPADAWRRMYMADMTAAGGYFKNIDACIGGDLLHAPVPGREYVAGIDLGRSQDFTVMTILDAQDRTVVYHAVWDPSDSWTDVRAGINGDANDWHVSRIIVDASGMGGDVMTEELMELGLPVEPFIITGQNRLDLLQRLAVAMERQVITFPRIAPMVRELRAFQYRRVNTRMGQQGVRLEAPPGEHDDEVFALALGLTACYEAPVAPGSLGPAASYRYAPTQDEANGAMRPGIGRAIMRNRQAERMRDRAERAGITL